MSNSTTISTAKHYDKFIKKSQFFSKEEERAVFTNMVRLKREIILRLLSSDIYRKIFVEIANSHFDKDSLLDFFLFDSEIAGDSTLEEVAEFYDDGMEYILNLSDTPSEMDLEILKSYYFSNDVYSKLIDSLTPSDSKLLKLDAPISIVNSIRNRLVEKNIAMGIEIVLRYMNVIEVPIDDATQVAMIGIITAVDKHNPLMKIKFSTSAYYWIFQSIQRYDDTNSNLISIPCNIVEMNKKNTKIITELVNKNGYFPTADEIIAASGNDSYVICGNSFDSFDTKMAIGNDNFTIADVIEDNNVISASNVVEYGILSSKIKQLVSSLSGNERQIIEMSYGWGDDGKSYTNKDIMSKLKLETYAFNKIKKSAYEHLQENIEDDIDFDNWKSVFAGVDNVD